jgi:uncharacterized protein YjbJ (UPF0337 family)
MTSSWIEGLGHRVKGALKENVGKMIGDAKLTSDGAAERAVGNAQNSGGPGGAQLTPGIEAGRIIGVAHQIRGSVKERFGNLIGDAQLAADGRTESRLGKTQDTAGSARDETRDAPEDQDAADSQPDPWANMRKD